jgi:23S rRNA (cytidine1920-2'-O)/16S rRNA (cytidine1409-2'-O)-methyltransferase
VKKRLDLLLVERGLIATREKARRMIMAGRISVDGRVVDKAGHQVKEDAVVTVSRAAMEYVSRGGQKLKGALESLRIDPSGKVAMDVGASTGGFTDCLLKEGAARVYAVDVGRGQLDSSLREDSRVIVLDRTNIRHLSREMIEEEIDLAVVDTSFISLRLVLPRVARFIRPGGEIVALIKPQFEVGRKDVGKGGIVKDPSRRAMAVEMISEFARSQGMAVLGTALSPIAGAKGNVEHFIYLRTPKGQ